MKNFYVGSTFFVEETEKEIEKAKLEEKKKNICLD